MTVGPGSCPRCRKALVERFLHEATLLACGFCGGVWLDTRACQAVMQGASRELVDLAERAERQATVVTDTAAPALCPVCARTLLMGEVPGTATEIHSCAAHGTWFDPNGLRRVAFAFADAVEPEPPVMSFGEWIRRPPLTGPPQG